MASIDLTSLVQPGETVLIAEGAAEPLTLSEALVEQRGALGGISVFFGMTLAGTFRPEHADHLAFRSYGALGQTRRLADARVLDIVPVALGQIPRLIAQGKLRFDVVMIALPPAGPDGRYSLGLTALFVPDAIRSARLVIAEVNHALPAVPGISVDPADIDIVIETQRPPPILKSAPGNPASTEVARIAAGFIGDGATLQLGVGAIPDALAAMLTDRRDLGIHSGLLGPGLGALIKSGAVTGARKPIDPGIATIGAVMGDELLYEFVRDNPMLQLAGVETTHGRATEIDNMVAVNGALAVDLWGQVNGETAGGRYIGAVGGQPDFARAGARAVNGRSIIVLNSTSPDGSVSNITATPVDRVTTARSDVDVVVTEFGAAELTGCDETERRRRLIAIAHPKFREALERAWR